jgi:hypothetical protein
MKKTKKELITGGRVLVRFNTGTKPHKSKKDYKRTPKHKKDLLGGSYFMILFAVNNLLYYSCSSCFDLLRIRK